MGDFKVFLVLLNVSGHMSQKSLNPRFQRWCQKKANVDIKLIGSSSQEKVFLSADVRQLMFSNGSGLDPLRDVYYHCLVLGNYLRP